MQRGPLFLAAAFVEVLRFFCLMFLAQAIGLLGVSPSSAPFVRYLAVAQLLLPAACFFLWLDGGRYAAYRPLALVGKAISLLAFLPLGLALASGLAGAGMPLSGRLVLPSATALLSCDLFTLLVLALHRRKAPEAREAATSAKAEVGVIQRGPEDIETVEENL